MALDLDKIAADVESLRLEDRLPKMDPNTEFHSDGDYCAYFFSGNDDTSLASAKRNLTNALMNVRRLAGAAGRSIVHLTHPGSDKGYRYHIATVKGYQSNRKPGSVKPKNWEALRAWLESYNRKLLPGTDLLVHIWSDREADDGVAAAARFGIEQGRTVAMFTRDKDFRMIAGRHMTWDDLSTVNVAPGAWEVVHDGLVYGQKWFWLQLIQGDSVDAIPGLPGIAKVGGDGFKSCAAACAESALALTANADQAYDVVQPLYEAYYGQLWPTMLAEQAMLLWLRTDNRADPADFLSAFPNKSRPIMNQAVDNIKRRIKWK